MYIYTNVYIYILIYILIYIYITIGSPGVHAGIFLVFREAVLSLSVSLSIYIQLSPHLEFAQEFFLVLREAVLF